MQHPCPLFGFLSCEYRNPHLMHLINICYFKNRMYQHQQNMKNRLFTTNLIVRTEHYWSQTYSQNWTLLITNLQPELNITDHKLTLSKLPVLKHLKKDIFIPTTSDNKHQRLLLQSLTGNRTTTTWIS